MADPELLSLVTELSKHANTYVPSTEQDAASSASKAALISLTKRIMHQVMDPGMMVQAHSLQMAELVCIRTLLDLKVFEHLPTEHGQTITAKELSERSGVQEALLGEYSIHFPAQRNRSYQGETVPLWIRFFLLHVKTLAAIRGRGEFTHVELDPRIV